MLLRNAILMCTTALLLLADAPLKEALGLTMEQARTVQVIQQKHRPGFVAKRQEYTTEMRKLRRARIANDRTLMLAHEQTARRLHAEMRAMQASEDTEIGRLLTPEQSRKFDAYLKQRAEMAGSSRDDKEFTGR